MEPASQVQTIRVVLPFHLRNLAGVDTSEVQVEVAGPVTQRSVLDALEKKYPPLRGSVRDHGTPKRRALVRFFACEEDISNDAPDAPLPKKIVDGEEAFWVVGAVAGG